MPSGLKLYVDGLEAARVPELDYNHEVVDLLDWYRWHAESRVVTVFYQQNLKLKML